MNEVSSILIDGDAQMAAAAAANGWSGNGSEQNPYVIENMNINGSGYAYCLAFHDLRTSHVVIRNNRLYNTSRIGGTSWKLAAIGAENCVYFKVENNTLTNLSMGGISIRCDEGEIRNNVLKDCRGAITSASTVGTMIVENNVMTNMATGMSCGGPTLVCVNNTISGPGRQSGQGAYIGSNNLTFSNNTISDFYTGIYTGTLTTSCVDNTVRDCTVGIACYSSSTVIDGNSIHNSTSGIQLVFDDVILRNNTLVDSYIELYETAELYLASHTIDGTNTVNGRPVQYLVNGSDIELDPSSYGEALLVGCTNISMKNRTDDTGYWIQAAYSDDISIKGNDMAMRVQTKWLFHNCDDMRMEDNTLELIDIRHSGDRFNMSNNSLVDGGVNLYKSTTVRIDNNTIRSDTSIPITIDHSNYVTIEDNNVTVSTPGIGRYAINMTNRCDRLIMRNNSLWGAGTSLPWGEEWGFQGSYYIDQSNTVNGRPILFSEDAISLRISDRYGQIIIYSADSVLIREATMGPGDGGIGMLYTDNVIIDNCTFEGLMNGAIDAKYCDDVTVSNCLFTGGNSQITYSGVNDIGMTTPGNITRCYFTNLTTNPSQPGVIHLLSSRFIGITKCYFTDIDGHGIVVKYGRTLTDIKVISYNEFRNCTKVAIVGWIGTTNAHHNAFVDNGLDTENSQCTMNTGVILDDGSEGNYWSNYRERYPYALKNGTFWDTPYDVGREADHFPYIDYHDFVPPMIRMYCNGSTDPGVTETFSSFSIDNQGVDRIQWWFLVHDDRAILNGSEVEFAFNSSGDHTVLLRVFDAAGNVAELSRVVRVTDYVSPRADAGPDLDVPPGATVTFNGSASWDDNTIASYEWTFVYGTFPFVLTGEFANFTFDVEGVYNVTLNVTDPAGHWDVDEMTVFVRDISPPTAFIGEDVTLDQGTELHLSGRGSTDNWRIDKYSWTITSPSGNVSRYSTAEVDHVFEEAGTHVVSLRVTDPKGLFDLASINVTALDVTPPVARVRDDVTIDQFETLVLDGTSSTDNEAVVNWTWTITGAGNDLVLYGPVTECSFGSVGYYDVLLTVTDAYGNNASASFAVTVSDAEPPTVVIGEDKEIETGDTVDLDGSGSTDNVGISKFTWTFVYNGMDVEKSGPSISYRFDQEGKYTITLTVEDMAGNSASDSLVVTVVTPFRDTEPPQALAGDDVTVDQHTRVTLDASPSTDNVGIVTFSWHIAGGDVDTTLDGASTEFTFDAVGEYTVTLTVADAAGNTATDELTVTVLDADPPVAEAGPNIQVKREETITLDGSASWDNVGVVSWLWTIEGQGLELTREGETVTLTLIAHGDYNVTLEVSDARGNTARDSLVLTVVPPPVNGHDEPGEEGISMVLVGGIAAAVIVAVFVVVLLVLRRKPEE